ncbi:DNA/RNA polymerase [Fomitopsis serialis]|uniref:DNA/RNA polymerase n=1 Tax=Fomitopsis serialis TaxID=139415 RepID=UPI002007AB93|nr:DNA/RNA polymerase [Neoantrodia serialis]KAH9919050.1 DNA/RNA polymerase [Neoantrodia serialis]
MISRSARKVETTLLSCSRQSLPRPARLYSTPSKRANAPALATASAPPEPFPAYMPSSSAHSQHDMEDFLRRRTPYTILPTPPLNATAKDLRTILFTDTPTQDLIAVVGACLHNLYDVPRAKSIFDDLRNSDKSSLLDVRMYNSMLDAYLEMARAKDATDPEMWIDEAWALYGVVEDGSAQIQPTANTYAYMLAAWIRHGPESAQPMYSERQWDPAMLLRSMMDHQVLPTMVVADRAFASSDEAAEAIQLLSKAAVEMGLSNVVNELGMADSLGRQEDDPLENVPEAVPVKRQLKKKEADVRMMHAEDGSVVDVHVSDDVGVPEPDVPFNLDTLRKHLAKVIFARRVLPEDIAARQKLLEESVYDVAVERLKHTTEKLEVLGLSNSALKTNDLQQLMWQWHALLKERLKAEIENIAVQEQRLKANAEMKLSETRKMIGLSPFLSLLTPEKLSLITILELMHMQGTGGVNMGMKTARALLSVGKAVELEHKAEMCKKHNVSIPTSGRAPSHGFFTSLGYRDLHAQRLAAHKYVQDSEDWASEWTQVVRVKIGSFLVDCLMDIATVVRTKKDKDTGEVYSEEQPAFFHSYEYLRGTKLGVIKLNPAIAEKMAKDSIRETLHPRHLPMLVKPKQWLGPDQGGYVYNKTWAMRFKDSQEQQSYLRRASSLGNLELLYTSLDILGSTPWQINRQVFDVVLEVWNSGERFCKIPPVIHDTPEPERPPNVETDPKARVAYLTRLKAHTVDKANNHSKRCDVNYKIEIARTFLGDTIYFPHNVDFRGRAYPLPPHLSHIGDDLSRGLLLFADKKPLGESGLRWLKIHLAGLYGYDKANFDERVQWVHERLDEIYDSAENPIAGRRWWTKADDPWQCLATCMELRNALDASDPLAYECALPVHQDGTCNGLQHYAALGGDAAGANQVNLGVTDRPSDVYTYVANMVGVQIDEGIEAGHKYAVMLKGKVSRKVVKQTVMTTVYGVTFVGARDQIEKQLKERGDIAPEECWLAASYLAKLVLGCIGDLFKGAKDIQEWLNICARLIAKSIPPERVDDSVRNLKSSMSSMTKEIRDAELVKLKKEQMTSVIWTTPLGLPIVQPYRATKRKQIITSMQSVYISDPNIPTAVNATKQASAFPPNFIHSLDATHMMLTALECRSQGLTFASVHDSYWTHAGTIDQMSTVIRDTFIALHSSNVLERLYNEFLERYKGYVVPFSALKWGKVLQRYGVTPGNIKVKTFPHSFMESADAADVAAAVEKSEEAATEDADEAAVEDANEAADCVELSEDKDEDATEGAVEPAKEKSLRRLKDKFAREVLQQSSEVGPLEAKLLDLGSVLPPVPKRGDFDVHTIKQSLYFFS